MTELAYTEKGFCTWKNATTSFSTHQNSQYHIESVEKVGKNSSQKDIAEICPKSMNQKNKKQGTAC